MNSCAASISTLPDRRNSRKCIPRHRKVCCKVYKTRYSRVPFGVLVTITLRAPFTVDRGGGHRVVLARARGTDGDNRNVKRSRLHKSETAKLRCGSQDVAHNQIE